MTTIQAVDAFRLAQLAQISTVTGATAGDLSGTRINQILDAKNKKQTEVDKLSEKFDTERISLMKALGEATDAETKLRIQSKIAILDNNEALAKKYLAEMNAVKGANDLALAFGAAVLSLSSTNADIAKYQNALAALQTEQLKAGTPLTAPNPADTAIVLSTARSTLDRLQESLPKLLERVQDRAATFDRSDTYIPSMANRRTCSSRYEHIC